MIRVALVLRGRGLPLDPYPDRPGSTIHNVAVSRRTLPLLLAALAAGVVILFPLLGCPFRASTRTRSASELAAAATSENGWEVRDSDLDKVEAA